MNEHIENALNELINTEIWSSNRYLSLQIHFERQQLPILSFWLNMQARSGIERICRMTSLIYRQGGRATIREATYNSREWGTTIEALDRMIEHENYMDGQVASLLKLTEMEDTDISQQIHQIYSQRFYVTSIFTEMLRIFGEESRRRLPFSDKLVHLE